MSATALRDSLPALEDAFTVSEDTLDVHVRAAIARMVSWCEKQPAGADFLARGLVIDTMGDITQQITDYFPAHIDTAPVIDDMAFVVAQNAKKSEQRFLELELAYIGNGKIPDAAQANLQSFVKWYSAENVIGDDGFGGFNKHLKPGWSGGAGGEGASLLKHLNLGTKKGFLMQVRALDITDAKAQTLLANHAVVQAFGASPAAMTQVANTIAGGGADGAKMQAVVDQIVEIKQLRAALTNAGDTPAAAPIAAALAHKTETLAAQMPQQNLPAPIKSEVSRTMDVVRVDAAARQVESVITTIAQALPPAVVAQAANDAPAAPNTVSNVQISQAVEAVQQIAQTHAMPVRDVIASVMTNTAAPEIVAPVQALTQVMAKPEFLPSIERQIPAQPALQIREALVTPPLQAQVQAPPSLPAVTQAVQQIAETTQLPTAKMAAVALEQIAAQPVAVEAVAPALRAPALQAVAENLQAVNMTSAVPEAAKPAIAVVAAQVETLAVQARQPELPAQPQTQQALPEQAPLAMLAKAVDVQPPAAVPPPAPEVVQQAAAPQQPTPQAPAQAQVQPQQPQVQSPVSPAATVMEMRAPESVPVQPVAQQPAQPVQPQQQANQQQQPAQEFKTYDYSPKNDRIGGGVDTMTRNDTTMRTNDPMARSDMRTDAWGAPAASPWGGTDMRGSSGWGQPTGASTGMGMQSSTDTMTMTSANQNKPAQAKKGGCGAAFCGACTGCSGGAKMEASLSSVSDSTFSAFLKPSGYKPS